jgi:hypothetical protein
VIGNKSKKQGATSQKVKTPKAAVKAKNSSPAAADRHAIPTKAETPAAELSKAVSTPDKAGSAASPRGRTPSTPAAAAAAGTTPRGRPPKSPKTVEGIRPLSATKTTETPALDATSSETSKTSATASAKLKTPSVAGKTPRLTTGKKSIKLGKTPKSGRTSVARPLWSEVVRKNLGKTPKKPKALALPQVAKAIKKASKASQLGKKTPRKAGGSRVALSSTGHAQSPEDIVIGRAQPKAQPVKLPKKGRKSEVRGLFYFYIFRHHCYQPVEIFRK